MILVGVVWGALAVLEGVAYARLPYGASTRRKLMTGCLAIVLLVSLPLALYDDWKIWLVPSLFVPYRLVNLMRLYAARLPEPQLRGVTLRAHSWLVAFQTAAAVIFWLIAHFSLRHWLVGTLAGFQLLSCLALLRASLHTWRHAEPFRQAQPMTDKELPTLSLLIPARNETDALDTCLRQLLASDYPKLEIIVLDDNSTNRHTPEIIRGFAHDGVRFVSGEVPDEANWLAKNQAYDRLSQEASGELLLFCGVDALFGPQTLRRLVEVLRTRDKEMLSVLPLKADSVRGHVSLLQPMRYYWELCLPRRFFKRPPVLSTCWLITAEAFKRAGGFASVSRSVTPEAHFARLAVVTDAYSFIRSNSELAFYSAKPTIEQYDTSVRMRYPQLHRRLELVALVTLMELIVFLGPIIGLTLSGFTAWPMAYIMIWAVCITALLVTYYLVAVATRLSSPWLAWLLMPVAFVTDIAIQHISMYKYEFARVEWKGRDVAVPVMRVIPHLPKLS